MICVYDFLRGEVSVKVGVMEFGLNQSRNARIYLRTQINVVRYFAQLSCKYILMQYEKANFCSAVIS